MSMDCSFFVWSVLIYFFQICIYLLPIITVLLASFVDYDYGYRLNVSCSSFIERDSEAYDSSRKQPYSDKSFIPLYSGDP